MLMGLNKKTLTSRSRHQPCRPQGRGIRQAFPQRLDAATAQAIDALHGPSARNGGEFSMGLARKRWSYSMRKCRKMSENVGKYDVNPQELRISPARLKLFTGQNEDDQQEISPGDKKVFISKFMRSQQQESIEIVNNNGNVTRSSTLNMCIYVYLPP
jgi:hypothetical protein